MQQGTSSTVSIWANFERHADMLRGLGATPEDIASLHAAAVAVDESAKGSAAEIDAATATAPVLVRSLDWTLPPATKEARSWARRAVLCVTGGREPSPGIGQLLAMLAGLWALRQVAEGKLDETMRAVSGSGALARVVAGLADGLQESGRMSEQGLQELAEDYARAMGFSLPPPLAGAVEAYTAAMERIAAAAMRRRIQASTKASSPRRKSACRGKRSGGARRPPSSTPNSSLRRTGSGRGSRP